MKVAVFSESSADEAALRILAEAGLGVTAEPVNLPSLRGRGWPSVRNLLPTVIKALHYGTDADLLLVVVDSDLSPIHLPDHDQPGGVSAQCRLCQLREAARKGHGQLKPRPGRAPLHFALGLAVPSVEAWFRCGIDAHVTEAIWLQGQAAGKWPYDVRRLKQAVYGTDRPGLALETTRMTEQARRLARDLTELETWFPNGFGPLLHDLRRVGPRTDDLGGQASDATSPGGEVP